MKKLIKIIGVFLAVVLTINVKADNYDGYIYEGETIPGIYFYKHRNDTEDIQYEFHNFHKQATVYRKSSDNEPVYCIESWEPLSGAGVGDYQEVTDSALTGLSSDKIKKIKKLIYFGYGYKDSTYDHTDIKWYAITQYLIWQIQAPEIEHYFVSSISSKTPIYPYENEINELNKLVKEEGVLSLSNIPFGSMNIKAKRIITINNKDKSNIKVTTTDNVKAEIKDGTIELTTLKGGVATITITKSFKRYNKQTKYYISTNYQNNMSIADMDDETVIIKLSVNEGTLTVNTYEVDDETKKLDDVELGLYANQPLTDDIAGITYQRGDLVATKKTKNGTAYFDQLIPGLYEIKEISPMDEYINGAQLNDFKVTPQEPNKVVDFYHQKQKVNINIKKYIEIPILKNNKIELIKDTKEGIVFTLFNEHEEEIISSITNSSGIANFNLYIKPGKYYIKETMTLEDYELDEKRYEFEFIVKGSDLVQDITIEDITNKIKHGILTIRKISSSTFEPINNTVFEILNNQGEVIKKISTNDHGLINMYLPYGIYFVREVKANDLYSIDKSLKKIVINDVNVTLLIKNDLIEQINEENKTLIETIIPEKILEEENIEVTEVLIPPTGLNNYNLLIVSFSLMLIKCLKKSI